MKIGILGAGHMCEALAPHFIAAGHDVMIGGRTPAKAESVARSLGVRSGSLRDAARFADTLLLAVLYQGLEHTLQSSGADAGALAGKVVIDCNNPVEVENFTLVAYPEGSLARHLAARTGAHVVKAFNLAQADVWRHVPSYGGHAPVIPVAGATEAKERAIALVRTIGADAVDVGGLDQAAYLEATAAIVIRQLWGGAEPTTTFQLVGADRVARTLGS
jgi:predicted dinucleotide-binding enzyme